MPIYFLAYHLAGQGNIKTPYTLLCTIWLDKGILLEKDTFKLHLFVLPAILTQIQCECSETLLSNGYTFVKYDLLNLSQ